MPAQIGRKDGIPAFVNIVSTTPSSDVLNKAKFVASFSSGDYVYFLFQEIDYIFSDVSSSASLNKVDAVLDCFFSEIPYNDKI
jgi:hypothetical protein